MRGERGRKLLVHGVALAPMAVNMLQVQGVWLGSADLHEQIRIQHLGGNAPSPRHGRHRQVIGELIDYVIPQLPAQQRPYVLLVVDAPELVPAQVPAHVSTCREPAA